MQTERARALCLHFGCVREIPILFILLVPSTFGNTYIELSRHFDVGPMIDLEKRETWRWIFLKLGSSN